MSPEQDWPCRIKGCRTGSQTPSAGLGGFEGDSSGTHSSAPGRRRGLGREWCSRQELSLSKDTMLRIRQLRAAQQCGCCWKTQRKENTTGRSAGEESGLDAELWTSTAPPAQILREQGSWLHYKEGRVLSGRLEWLCLQGDKVISTTPMIWGPQIIPAWENQFANMPPGCQGHEIRFGTLLLALSSLCSELKTKCLPQSLPGVWLTRPISAGDQNHLRAQPQLPPAAQVRELNFPARFHLSVWLICHKHADKALLAVNWGWRWRSKLVSSGTKLTSYH